ncbi:ABC transporter permease [Chlamydiales bacterium]|nr:ABC transporter permease [Chlamydiales bacterium]
MYLIAIKMLTGDRAKYLLLISALTIATLLMTQQGSVFLGLLRWSTATIRNTGVPIYVVDPLVEQVNEIQPMRDTDLARVRSVRGVDWAVPLYFSIQQARLDTGVFKSIQLMGLDQATLIGAPTRMLEGRLDSLWQANSVIIDEVAVERFSVGRKEPIGIGDTFEINDHEARIVGICQVERSFFGYPYIYTTYDRAISFAPKRRKNLGYVLVNPQEGVNHEALAREIEKETGLKTYTEKEFSASTIRWFFNNTGIPLSFGTTIILGFLVGVAVSGQTFYSFILENLPHLGALKAMGASNRLLTKMLLLQALLVGTIGYGIGVGLTSIFGFMALRSKKIPFYLPYEVLLIALFAILLICIFSAFLGIRKIRKLDVAEVFRA